MTNVGLIHALWAVAASLVLLSGAIVFATLASLYMWWKEE